MEENTRQARSTMCTSISWHERMPNRNTNIAKVETDSGVKPRRSFETSCEGTTSESQRQNALRVGYEVCGQYTDPNMYKERSKPNDARRVRAKRFVSLDDLDVAGQRGGTKIDAYG